jgi:meiotic recombination protein SPO11
MRLLDLTHEAILDDLPATKRFIFCVNSLICSKEFLRDIFYKDVALFKTQKVVDNVRIISINAFINFDVHP